MTVFVFEEHFNEFVTNSLVLQPTVRELRLTGRRFEPLVDTICRLVKGSDFIHMLEFYVGSDFNETLVALMKDAFSANKTLTSIVITGHDDYVKLIKPGLYSLRNRIAEIPAEEAVPQSPRRCESWRTQAQCPLYVLQTIRLLFFC